MRRYAIARLFTIAAVCAAIMLCSGAAAAQEKRHQATGTIAAAAPTQLVLLKQFGRNQARWNFVLNPKTKLDGKLTKGQRVRIYYYNDAKGQRVAEQIKILVPATTANAAPARTPAASPPQPAQ